MYFLLGVMALLRPLLLDVVPTVQQTAAEQNVRELLTYHAQSIFNKEMLSEGM